MTVANLRDTAALQRLATGLKRFAAEITEALQSKTMQIQRQQRELETLKTERQNMWRRCMTTLQQAAADLRACEASGYTDKEGHYHSPICTSQEILYRKARDSEQIAKTALVRVEKKVQRLEQQALAFQKQGLHMKNYLESNLLKGANQLHALSGIVQEYTQISPSNISSSDSGDFTKLIDAAIGAPLGVLEAISGILSPAKPNPHWLPDTFPKPYAGCKWVFVPLEQIEITDSYVHSPEDFKKVPLEEMKRGWKVFYADVLPAVQQGKTEDYFDQLDTSLGLPPAKGFRQVFDAFLGTKQWNEPIRLEQKGEKYVVTNGYHRLYAAKELGLTQIIASVVGE